jgi:hypothetical protein
LQLDFPASGALEAVYFPQVGGGKRGEDAKVDDWRSAGLYGWSGASFEVAVSRERARGRGVFRGKPAPAAGFRGRRRE